MTSVGPGPLGHELLEVQGDAPQGVQACASWTGQGGGGAASAVQMITQAAGAAGVAAAAAVCSHPRTDRALMRITEIYASIQGETQYAGLPCTLVRTTGCDLRCGYCDTAYSFYGGKDMALEDIAAEVERLGAPLVLLTGGEPMLQREIVALAELLLSRSYRVMIETSGAHPVDQLPAEVIRIVDLKTPGSGENHRVRWDVLDGLGRKDAVKFVLTDEADYRWAAEVIRSRELAGRTEVLLSPVHGRLDPARAGRLVAARPPAGAAESAAAQVRLGAGRSRSLTGWPGGVS